MSLRYETSLRETKQMTNLQEEYKIISILFIFLHPRVVHPAYGCPSLLAVVAGQGFHLGLNEKYQILTQLTILTIMAGHCQCLHQGGYEKRMFTSAQNQSTRALYSNMIFIKTNQSCCRSLPQHFCLLCHLLCSSKQTCQFYGTIVHRIQLLRVRHMYR